VALLEPCLPCLEELHLAGNGISSLQPPCQEPEAAQGPGTAAAPLDAQHVQRGAQAKVSGFLRLKVRRRRGAQRAWCGAQRGGPVVGC